MLDRRFEYWLTLVIGVFAAGTWMSQAVRALTEDGELSATGLFVWLAAAIAGVAIGVVVGMLTAGFRARPDARQMARGGPNAVWDMSRYAVVMGIFFLGWGTDPIFADPQGLWAWTYPLIAATAAGMMFGIAFLLRDERRLRSRHRGTIRLPRDTRPSRVTGGTLADRTARTGTHQNGGFAFHGHDRAIRGECGRW